MYRRFILASFALSASPVAAHAVGFMTQLNCASDYYAYCSKHPIGSPGVRNCMRANGQRLSNACINALISDGEITRADVEREKARILAARVKTQAKAEAKKKALAAAKLAKSKKTAVAEAKLNKPSVMAEADATLASATPAVPKPKPAVRVAALHRRLMTKPERPAMQLDADTFAALKARGPRFVVEEASYVAAAQPQRRDPSIAIASLQAQTTPAWTTTVITGDRRPVAVSVAENAPDAQDEPIAVADAEFRSETQSGPQAIPREIPTRTVHTTVIHEPPIERAEAGPAPQRIAVRSTRKVDYSYGRMSLGLGLPSREKSEPEPSLWDKVVAFFSSAAAN